MPYAVSQRGMKPKITHHLIQSRRFSHWLQLMVALGGLTVILLASCTTGQRYVEKHQIKQLTVVFLDEQSLHEQWAQLAGRAPIQFTTPMSSTTPLIKTVRGFYDYSTKTLYCEKWNYEVCGHELHHAVLGQFHPQH